MSGLCDRLHSLLRELPLLGFPLDMELVPVNGVYVMFERGEKGHGADRIVRVGTHTGAGQLRSRMKQHFLNENKDRSIFRKHVGRALLNRDNDPFIAQWNLDLTSGKARKEHSHAVDFDKQQQVEERVTDYLQTNLRFVCFRVDERAQRLKWERKIISTVSTCDECGPSPYWLGLHALNPKIRESGLWLVQGLCKEPLRQEECEALEELVWRQPPPDGL